VAGLVEPGVELGRVLADRAETLARAGRLDDARPPAAEAAALARDAAYDGYRQRLDAIPAATATRS
jgi:hypothetical protein